jgi:polyhydroxyalkanoate synthesis regulator phasin
MPTTPMGSGTSAYGGWGGTGGTTGSTGQNAGLTGSTGGATPGSNPTGGSNVWDTTNRNAPSPWGSTGTYSTQPVGPSGNPVNWNGSSGLPPMPSPSVGTGTGDQYSTNPVMPQSSNPGTQVNVPNPNSFTWSPPSWVQGQDQAGWGNPAMTQALQNYAQLQPWIQTQQNAMQYGQDFNENQRRWNQQFGWTQQNDQFNQGLAQQQQAMAQWVAQQQQNNWGQQFGLDSELGRGNLALGNRQAGIDEMYKQGQLGVAQQQNVIDEMFKRGQLTNEQYANESNRLYQSGQLGIGNRELDIKDWYQRNQLAQEAALTREGFTNQQQIASMNAFGRAQRPQARWIRSW